MKIKSIGEKSSILFCVKMVKCCLRLKINCYLCNIFNINNYEQSVSEIQMVDTSMGMCLD